MKTRLLPALALVSLAFLSSFALQKRVKPKSEADFAGTLRAAGAAWESGEYGACVKELNMALGLATTKRAESIRAAFPTAPAGWKADPEKKGAKAANNPLAGLVAAVGNVIQRTYRQDGGRGRIDVTLTADSPMVQMVSMWMTNPAMAGQGAELIEYEAHRAILKKEGNGLSLQILIHGAHLCEVRTSGGVGEEQLFAMFDQKVVDALAKVLGK